MCDFSLQAVKSRPAKVADKLVVVNFGHGTKGFAAAGELDCAVCLTPGTEIAFDKVAVSGFTFMFQERKRFDRVAIFRQINKSVPNTHHDVLEFPDGQHELLTLLNEGQTATVLQLPAEPKTPTEAAEQKRAEYVG